MRSKVTHLLSGDRVLLHIFLGAFATEVAADFAKGGFFETESANGALTTANFLLDGRSKSARIATFSSNVHNAGRKLGCFFEKMDNFSLILPNFSKKVHHFFAKGVKNEHKQNGDLCEHDVRSPKKGN